MRCAASSEVWANSRTLRWTVPDHPPAVFKWDASSWGTSTCSLLLDACRLCPSAHLMPCTVISSRATGWMPPSIAGSGRSGRASRMPPLASPAHSSRSSSSQKHVCVSHRPPPILDIQSMRHMGVCPVVLYVAGLHSTHISQGSMHHDNQLCSNASTASEQHMPQLSVHQDIAHLFRPPAPAAAAVERPGSSPPPPPRNSVMKCVTSLRPRARQYVPIHDVSRCSGTQAKLPYHPYQYQAHP